MFEVVVLVVDHVLFVERLANLTIFVLSLPIAVPGTISHSFFFDTSFKFLLN